MESDMQVVTTNVAMEKQAEVVIFSTMKAVVEVAGKMTEVAVEFYKEAFGAKEIKRVECRKRKNGQEKPLLVSAELMIGSDSFLVMDSETDNVNESGILLCLETENVNGAISNAVEFGAIQASVINEGEDGSKISKLKDPFGIAWIIASSAAKKNCTHVESKLEAEAEAEEEAEALKKQTEVVILSSIKGVVEVAGKKVEAAVEFYKKAFGADEVKRVECCKRKNDQEHPWLISVELKIGSDSFLVMDSEIVNDYVNENEAISEALESGATQVDAINEVEGCGIFGKFNDPFGAAWIMASFDVKNNCTLAESNSEPKENVEALNEAASATDAPIVA